MMILNGFKEASDVSIENKENKPEISQDAKDKFEKIMGDERLPESEKEIVKSEEIEFSYSDLLDKFENLFKPDAVSGIGYTEADQKPDLDVEDEIYEKDKDSVFCETTEGTSVEKIGLTESEKSKIMIETGWSAEIVNCIENIEQYEVYKDANLTETEIDGRKCLIKTIDMDYVDLKTGMTNRELMKKGRTPIDEKTGESIELHHMGQDFNSPFAELCANSEHGDGKDAILHDKKIESWRQDSEKKNYYNNVQRPNHWKDRAEEA